MKKKYSYKPDIMFIHISKDGTITVHFNRGKYWKDMAERWTCYGDHLSVEYVIEGDHNYVTISGTYVRETKASVVLKDWSINKF